MGITFLLSEEISSPAVTVFDRNRAEIVAGVLLRNASHRLLLTVDSGDGIATSPKRATG